MNSITSTLHTIAEEAKAEETKIIGRHRKALSPQQKIAHKAHRAFVHVYHTGQLAWIGLPAIFAFEAARPIWERFVETPIANTLFGEHTETVHALPATVSTIAQHYIG